MGDLISRQAAIDAVNVGNLHPGIIKSLGNAPYWICKNWDGGTDADGFCYEAERR